MSLGLFAGALALGPAHAQTASELLFSCSIGARQVTVSKQDSRFVYRFGTAARSEIVIVGEPALGNIFRLRKRYAGPETQVRFTKGEFSYIVFSAEGNPQTGARSVSGLTVMRGLKTVSSLACARFTEFRDFDEAFGAAPQDREAYSGM